ncbi:hypothetical protein MCUN1_002334 [Malassezia cuniculi]|uniref:Uncharacterized protein n=1 Tax=Malassezia cuniculi TaxID=948313 RepID=A0AAF0ERD6_9BASI|nr:hypothetical protein MCUN1_002334 [Malassezia cuniculi]
MLLTAIFARGAGAGAAVRRALHSSAVRDPVRETGLYYHALGDGEWAISLRADAPDRPDSPWVVGRLAVPAAVEPPAHLRNRPDSVRLNARFWDELHHVFREHVAHDETLQFEANMRENGWAHLSDMRDSLHLVRTPTPDSIFGTVAFVERKIDPSTYERNPIGMAQSGI